MKKTRCALVGVGHRAFSWLDGALVQHAGRIDVAALCDTVIGRCADINRAYQIRARAYTDYDRMLREIKPELVVITSPDHVHAEHVIKALDAGCRVACEKPLCTQGAQARDVLAAEKRNRRKIFMAFNYRHVPLCSKLKELILNDAVGRVVSMDLTWYLDYKGHGASYFRRWHRLMQKSGGLLITKATHHFDMANWLIGDYPRSVYARCKLNFFGKGKSPFSGTRCRDCRHAARCKFYYEQTDVARRSRELGYRVKLVRDYEGDTCVFSDDVDIYDTMALTVEYRGGALLTYSLNAGVPFEGWNIAINGSKGRIETKLTDAKPAQGWRKQLKVLAGARGTRIMGPDECRVVNWPDHYTIFVMPHDAPAYEVEVPNVLEGHGGGDARVFERFYGGKRGKDPLGLFATAIDGAASMVVGAAANLSAESNRPVDMRELLGDWLD